MRKIDMVPDYLKLKKKKIKSYCWIAVMHFNIFWRKKEWHPKQSQKINTFNSSELWNSFPEPEKMEEVKSREVICEVYGDHVFLV